MLWQKEEQKHKIERNKIGERDERERERLEDRFT